MSAGRMSVDIRHSGIPAIGDCPWGTHFCVFYRTRDDLTEILVPYFKAGLEGNELCVWITADPLHVQGARRALAAGVPGLDDYIGRGQIEFLDAGDWSTPPGSLDPEQASQGWAAWVKQAAERGLAGLRVTGNASWLTAADWLPFTDYEGRVNTVAETNPMIALCTYPLDSYPLDSRAPAQILDVVSHHDFALARLESGWQELNGADRRRARERYHMEVKRRDRELSILYAINRAATGPLNLEQSMDDALGAALQALDVEAGSIYLFEAGRELLEMHALRGLPEEFRPRRQLSLGEGVAGKAAAGRRPLVFDAADYASVSPDLDIRVQGFQSFAGIPLLASGQVIGALALLTCRAAAFPPEDLNLLTAIGQQLGAYVSNARLYETLEQRSAQLEAANRELEAFSFSVSHDLRAPLRAINNFARILREDCATQLTSEAQHYLEIVDENSQRMAELLDGLLAFSRLGRQALSKQPVDTLHLVRQVLDELRPDMEGRAVEIALGELLPCQGDPVLLKQVWVNLIANALKFTRGCSPAAIEIGGSVAWPPAAGGAARPDGQSVPPPAEPLEVAGERHPVMAYYVRDNGAGFDMQHAGKLFGVFQRLHSEEEYEGSGVGLAIVQRIVHRHGGRVWGEGRVDGGATFYFTLGEQAER